MDQHIPGQTDAAIESAVEVPAPAPETPIVPETKPETVPEGEVKSEAAKPEDKPASEVKPPEEPKLPKKRSIYDDLKDEKQTRKEAEARNAELEAELARLRGEKPEAPVTPEKPAAPAEPKTELDTFAEEQGLDAAALKRLAEILTKQLPASQLSETEKQTLEDLKAFKQDADAKEQRRKEDEAIQADAPKVKKDLDIHNDAELAAVMAEVTRLAHTKEFADKEVDYIIFRNREALAKLVSPKKPSFESGGQNSEAPADAEPDLSKGGVTPEMAQKATQGRGRPSQLEIRKAV